MLFLALSRKTEGEGLSVEYRQEPSKINKDYFESWEAPQDTLFLPVNNSPATRFLSQKAPIELENKVKAVFGVNSDMALRVIACESNFRTDVISKTSDVGLFQINLAAHGAKIAPTRAEQIAWLQNPDNNIAFAYELFKKSGWFPWVCYTKKLI